MTTLLAIFRREALSYVTTPTAYVFVAIFLFAIGLFTFQVGGFFGRGVADLQPFFMFHPWIFMVFLPGIAMRLWAEETHGGTIETLMTLPAPTWALVVGKFAAAWAVAVVALIFTAPMWISVNVLGDADNLAILAGYLASVLMAGAYIAIGSSMSALAPSQVAAFVLAVLAAFVLTALGLPMVSDAFTGLMRADLALAISRFSILHHFDAAQRGVIELRSVIYFASVIALFLGFTALAVDARRGG